MAALNIRPMTPPAAGTSATYGEWPNQRSRTTIPATGSLVGDHVVRGNYRPEIRFALNQSQDFLPPIALTSNTAAASGAVPVAWRPVANARAYYLMSVGPAQDSTMVMWSSSEVQANMMGLRLSLRRRDRAPAPAARRCFRRRRPSAPCRRK